MKRIGIKVSRHSSYTSMQSFLLVEIMKWIKLCLIFLQEKVLFRKMMYTNAARVPQDDHYVVWKNSYISPLFPQESIKSAPSKLTNERTRFSL